MFGLFCPNSHPNSPQIHLVLWAPPFTRELYSVAAPQHYSSWHNLSKFSHDFHTKSHKTQIISCRAARGVAESGRRMSVKWAVCPRGVELPGQVVCGCDARTVAGWMLYLLDQAWGWDLADVRKILTLLRGTTIFVSWVGGMLWFGRSGPRRNFNAGR